MQNPLLRKTLTDFGQYVGEMLPKYVQKVEVTNCEELDIMIHPEGIIPTMQFLKDHHNAQFLNIIDIAGMDVPTRPYRFEVVYSQFTNILTRFSTLEPSQPFHICSIY